jgi:hypothetical protein
MRDGKCEQAIDGKRIKGICALPGGSGEWRSLLDLRREVNGSRREKTSANITAIRDNLSSYFLFGTHSNGMYWGVSWVVGRSWRKF